MPDLRVTIVPNGIDSECLRPIARNNALVKSLSLIYEGQVEEMPRVVGFAGELRKKKGPHPLLSAYAQVNKENPCTLLIVGDVRTGDDRQVVKAFQLSHPETGIVVTGFVSPQDLPTYYSWMDVFVQSSLRDGLPNALLEAMACEKAAIDCENGKLVSTNDVSQLANEINELLTNDDLRTRLVRAARQTIVDDFTLQAELDGNLGVYHRLGLKM